MEYHSRLNLQGLLGKIICTRVLHTRENINYNINSNIYNINKNIKLV